MSSKPNLPARVEQSTVPDRYEAEYMKADGTMLYRVKSRMPWQLGALIAGVGGVTVLGSVLVGSLGSLFALPIIAAIALLFAILRVTVSEGSVNIQYGLFGPKIPMAAIESAEAITYDWKKFGGWGIKRSFDGEWIYNMPGDEGKAVRIVWRTTKGKRKVTLVGTREAEPMAAAITQAQRALPAAATRELPEAES